MLGHNGAGKTTLINVLCGNIKPTTGYAKIKNINITEEKNSNLKLKRDLIGLCPQHDILWDELTPKEHIELYSIIRGYQSKDINLISQDDNSGFLDEDIKENKTGGMLDFIKNTTENVDETNSRRSGVHGGISIKSQVSSNNEYKASEKKVDDYLNKGIIEENDLDIIKQNEEQMKLLKNEIKEKNNKLNMLTEQIDELMKNIKCDMKNKPQIVQICQILGKSPEEVNKIVNKKKSIF